MTQEVKLQIQYGHRSWTVYKSDPWEYETIERVFKAGDKLEMVGFYGHQITEITDACIVIEFSEERYILTHDEPLHLFSKIEGREWSDGCVYDGDDYSIDVVWLKD